MESSGQPRRVISVAIGPKAVDDGEKLQRALSDLMREDPGISVEAGPAERQVTLSGMGELHLGVICNRIECEYKIPLDVGPYRVIYLETIRKQSEAEGKYVRAFSRHCMYGHVKIRLEPREAGSGYEFANEIKDEAVPARFVEPVNLGIQAAMKGGVLAGHEIVDLRAVLYDGSYHAGDSNEMAFKIAGSMAFKDAARKASPVVLEPLMSVESVAPEEFVGAIVGNLSRRRGRIEGMEHRAGSQVIHATVPMATMIGGEQHMRSITQGRAKCSISFARYEEVPRRDESEGERSGVTANKPKRPKAGTGFAAAQWDDES